MSAVCTPTTTSSSTASASAIPARGLRRGGADIEAGPADTGPADTGPADTGQELVGCEIELVGIAPVWVIRGGSGPSRSGSSPAACRGRSSKPSELPEATGLEGSYPAVMLLVSFLSRFHPFRRSVKGVRRYRSRPSP
nr:hypothetical protein GCM10020063_070900 [Dactylosporangium thailandense]